MDGSEFTILVRRTHPSQGLRLRFRKDTGIIALMRLNSICDHDSRVSFDERDKVVVAAILMSQDWGGDHNRTLGVRGLMHANHDHLDQLAHDIEELELAEKHPALSLMAKRQKARDEAVRLIVDGVLTADLKNEVEEWGLTIVGESTQYLGCSAVQFMICQPDGEMILRITLDGWTGHYGIDGGVGDNLYKDPRQLRDFISASLEQRLEELTTEKAA